MLEQQLINAFMKLTAKVGAGELVRELVQQVDENGNPKVWTSQEMESAIHFIETHVQNFGKNEATGVVLTLMKKFDISLHDLQPYNESHLESSGIQGLQ